MRNSISCVSKMIQDWCCGPQLRSRSLSSRRQSVAAQLSCETLEDRRLLSASGFGVDANFGVQVTSDIVYRNDAEVGFGTPGGVTTTELKLDLYTPTGAGLPTTLPGAILIHGGGFTGGDKAQQSFVDLANDFASRGYVTASINYRLAGDNPPPALPNFPIDQDPLYHTIVAGIEDTFHAISWMKSSAATLNIDVDRIVLGGHSAGGFLSNYAGMVDAPDIVSLSDMTLDISQLDVAAVLDAAGGINGQEHVIDSNDPPTFIMHSTDDPVVLVAEANILAAELTADGVPFEFPVITNAGHGLDAKLDTVVNETTVRQQMFEFFRTQLDLDGLIVPQAELTLTIADTSVSEAAGQDVTTATVSRNSNTINPLTITLSSSATDEATVPVTVTIAADATTSDPFDITGINDYVLDGTQTVTITAQAVGHISGVDTLDVTEAYAHRISDLTIRVVDENGDPRPDAVIDLQMTDHAFKFGTQVRDRLFTIDQAEFDTLSDTQKQGLLPNLQSQFGIALHTPDWQDVLNYRNEVLTHFNHVVPTTGLQWIALNNNGPVIPDAAITFAQANGLTATGASVVWQKDAWPTPAEFRSDQSPDATTFHNALINDRLSGNGILGRYSSTGAGPSVTDWKLLNEPLHQTYYADTFVAGGIYTDVVAAQADYFIQAASVRPDADLSINDYNILNTGNENSAIAYRDLINDLLAAGAPIDRIGVQAHMARNDVTKADMIHRLDILAETGLRIEITEFDTRDDANQLTAAEQEQIFRDLLEVSWEHSAVDGFIMWGIWDAGHWRGNAALYDTDWNVKTEAAPWFDLVKGAWMSDLTGVTVDGAGEWMADHGLFSGTYNLTARQGLVSTTVSNVDIGGTGEIVITLADPAVTLTLNDTSISEGAGNGGTTAIVSRNTDMTNPLAVTLSSSDTGEAVVPVTVTIAAGQSLSGPFDVDAVNDAVIDGTQSVQITASAPGHTGGLAVLEVTDDDLAQWSISSTAPYISEDAAGTESVVYSLSGTFAEGEQASVQLNLLDITTNSTDYSDTGLDLFNAVNAYSGAGTLSLDPTTGVVTYSGGVGGTSMTDLVVAINPIDDTDFEYTESLEVSLTNAAGSTIDAGQSLITISILDNDGTALDRYVAKPDATYDYQLTNTTVGNGLTTYVIDMTSQTWRSLAEVDRPVWEHEVHLFVPDGTTSDTAILYIGSGDNGDPNQAIERSLAADVALHTGQMTVYLPTVPNQSLTFTDDGIARREDSILAYSFDKYLDGGDDEWPALLPMVKSAVRAMDTAQDFLANNTAQTASDFFVTGGSKRGWTTYLTAAADPRVTAITPVVFDYVNLSPTLEFHQHVYDGVTAGTVGGYAEVLQDYVNFGVFDRIGTPEYFALSDMIDPYFYRDRLTQPKFAVLSTGDQFMPMGAQFYINDFQGPTYLRYIPNTGHEAGRSEGKGFFKALDAGETLPVYDWTVEGSYDNTIRLNSTTTPVEVNLWQATNPNSLDFRIDYFGANWTRTTLTDQGGGEYVGTVQPPASGGTAFLVEMKYNVGGEILTLTTEARIVEPVNDLPVITILGQSTQVLEGVRGAAFNDPGYTASDVEDGDLTVQVVVAGAPVDLGTTGDFLIRYNVVDTAGAAAVEQTRTVSIVDTLPPVTSLYLDGELIQQGDNSQLGVGGVPNTELGQSTPTAAESVGPAVRLPQPTDRETGILQPDGTTVNSRQIWVVTWAAAAAVPPELPTASTWDKLDDPVEPTTTIVLIDLDGSAREMVVTEVDFRERSTYLFQYDAQDSSGNHAEQLTFALILNDRTAPVIQLGGEPNQIVEQDTDWTLGAATATDNIDGSLDDVLRYRIENVTAGTVLGSELTYAEAANLLTTSAVADYVVQISVHDNAGIYGQNNVDNSTAVTQNISVRNTFNDAPTLDPVSNLTIAEDASQQTVNLTGITAGGSESQPLRVTASSNNTGLIPNPTVTYTSAEATGSLQFTPVADAFSTATITVSVEDGGLDNDLGTAGDNATFSRTFNVTVNPVNDVPTLDAIADLTIDEDAAEQTVNVTGLSAGAQNEAGILLLSAVSSNPGLIPNSTVTYTSPNPTGSLAFTPVADQSGTATITVTVEDGGNDNDLNTPGDNAMFSRTFDVTVIPVGVTTVRVRLTDNDYLQLLEVQVLERGTGTALDDSGTASQSSTYNANTGAEKAIDGDTTSGYPSSLALTGKQFGSWWEVDLGGTFDVQTIVVYNRGVAGGRLEDAVVEALDFGGNVLWSDIITGTSNGSVHQFTVRFGADTTAPVADLADPVNGGTTAAAALNGRDYLDVTFADGAGSGVDLATIDGDELSLSGAGLGTAALDGTVTLLGGSTYRYGLNSAGEFVAGSVDVTFVGGSWRDNAGNAGVSEIETFTVQADTSEVVTAVRVRLTDNDYLQLLEVEVLERDSGTALDDSGTASQSSTYNPNTGAEKAIDGNTTSGYPSSLALTGKQFGSWWEVDLGGTFDVQTIVVYNRGVAGARLEDAVVEALDFGGNVVWFDTITGASNASVHPFTVSFGADNTAPVADLANPVNGGTIDVGILNGRDYLDVTFADGDGSGVDLATINGDELSLSGAGVGTAALDGTVTLVGGSTYRYGLNPSGEFVAGSVDVMFVGGSWQDNAGNAGVSETETFTVTLTPAGVTAVRVRLTDNDYLQLSEVQVLERGTGTALDDSGTASQSSNYNANTGAEKAIDGDTASGYPSSLALTGKELGAWWKVDLDGAFDVETVVVYNRDVAGDRLEGAVVEALDFDGNVLWSDTITGAANASVHTFTVSSAAVNELPKLDALADLTIGEDAAEQTVNLAGITDGDSGTQPLRVTASSSNPSLIPDPTVTYTSPNVTGSLAFTPASDQYGTTTITVTVEDGGVDNDLNTAGDNATFSRTFDVTVKPAGVTAVRVRLTDNDYLQLSEVQVLERGTGTALDDSGTASQSSNYNANTGAEKAIDGDTASGYPSSLALTGKELGAWWKVDLDGGFDVETIVVYNRDVAGDRLEGAVVEALDFDGNVLWSDTITGAANASVHTFAVNPLNPFNDSPDSLVAYWDFEADEQDKASAGIVADDGTLTGAAIVNGGLGTSALEFSGGEDVMELESSADINLGNTTEKSISLWFQPDSLSGRQVLYQQGESNRGLNIYIENGSIYAGGWNAAVGWDGTWLSSANITQNAWNHVTFTYNAVAGEVKLYVNGAAPLVGTASAISSHGRATLGSAREGSRYKDGAGFVTSSLRNSYSGLVDDVRVYQRALTDKEAAVLATASPV